MSGKKALILGMTFAAAVLAGNAQAAPVTYIPMGSGNVGYTYNNAVDGIHNVYAEFSPISKVVVGAEYRDWINRGHETDIYAKYRMGHNVYIGLGNRNYYDRSARLYGLVEGMTNVAPRLDAYAGLKFNDTEREYSVGAMYDLIPSVDLDVHYTYYDRDNTASKDGVGVGVNYRF